MFCSVLSTALKQGVIRSLNGARSGDCTKLSKSPYFINWRFTSTKPTSSGSSVSEASSKTPVSKEGFVLIYKLPQMPTVATVCRTRIVGTVFLLVTTPMALALSYVGFIPSDYGLFACLAAGGSIIKLYFLGMLCTNTVGLVYSSPDASTVKISYLDAVGRRKDDIFPTSDLIPLSELPSSRFDVLYSTLRRYSQSSRVYKLNLSHGQITDRDRFCTIFGKVD